MLIFKTYTDLFSEKPQAGSASSAEFGSFVFDDTTGITVNYAVSDLHPPW